MTVTNSTHKTTTTIVVTWVSMAIPFAVRAVVPVVTCGEVKGVITRLHLLKALTFQLTRVKESAEAVIQVRGGAHQEVPCERGDIVPHCAEPSGESALLPLLLLSHTHSTMAVILLGRVELGYFLSP